MGNEQPVSDGGQPNPWASFAADAKAGNLRIRMDLEQFVYLDRACETFLDNIGRIKEIADRVSQQEHWGLGEGVRTADGNQLISGKTLVARFREKARGGENSVYAVMESHRVAVEGIQEVFRLVRQRVTEVDADAAARYEQLAAGLPATPVSVSRYAVPCTPEGSRYQPVGAVGVEPGRIPDGGEYAQSWGNGQLKEVFDRLDVTDAFTAREQYVDMVNQWQEGVEGFLVSVKRAISEAWEGVSADAATSAIAAYTRDAEGLGDPLTVLAAHIDNCAQAVLRTKHALPETVIVDATSWWSLPYRFSLEHRQGQSRQQAWDMFTHHYVQPLGAIDTQVPLLPLAGSPTHAQAPRPEPAGARDTGGFSGGAAGSASSDSGFDNQTADSRPSGDAPAAGGSHDQGRRDAGTGTTQRPAVEQTTTPAGLGSSTLPAGLDHDPTYGSGGIGRGGGAGSAPHGGVAHGGIGPGRGGIRPGGLPGTQNPAATAADARSGAAGMGGMPGMPPPGRGGEDKEHRTPAYLVNADNGRELIGDWPEPMPFHIVDGVITAGALEGDDDCRDRPL